MSEVYSREMDFLDVRFARLIIVLHSHIPCRMVVPIMCSSVIHTGPHICTSLPGFPKIGLTNFCPSVGYKMSSPCSFNLYFLSNECDVNYSVMFIRQ